MEEGEGGQENEEGGKDKKGVEGRTKLRKRKIKGRIGEKNEKRIKEK